MTFFPKNGFEDPDPEPYQNKPDPQHKKEETDKKHSLIGISVIFFTGTKFWEKEMVPLRKKTSDLPYPCTFGSGKPKIPG